MALTAERVRPILDITDSTEKENTMDEILGVVLLLFLIGTFTYFILPVLPIIAIVYMIVGSVMNLLEL